MSHEAVNREKQRISYLYDELRTLFNVRNALHRMVANTDQQINDKQATICLLYANLFRDARLEHLQEEPEMFKEEVAEVFPPLPMPPRSPSP